MTKSTAQINKNPVERIYPDDTRVKPQTIAHHMARYKFASNQPRYALDLACGTGYGTDIIRKSGFETTGIDNSKEAIDYALKHYPKCSFYQMTLPFFEIKPYHLITCFEALEHLEYFDALQVLDKVKECLVPGGTFIVSVPRDENPIYNKFHKSHWDFNILEEILRVRFKTVEIYGQDWDTSKIFLKGLKQDNDFFIFVCKND